MRFLLSLLFPLLVILCLSDPFDSQAASRNDGFYSKRRPRPMRVVTDNNGGGSGGTGDSSPSSVWSPEDGLIDEKDLSNDDLSMLLKRTEVKLAELKGKIDVATEDSRKANETYAKKEKECQEAESKWKKLDGIAKEKTKALDDLKDLAKKARVELIAATEASKDANETLSIYESLLEEVEQNINETQTVIDGLKNMEAKKNEQQKVVIQLTTDIAKLDTLVTNLATDRPKKTTKVTDAETEKNQWVNKNNQVGCTARTGQCKTILEQLDASENLLVEAKRALKEADDESLSATKNRTQLKTAKIRAESEVSRLTIDLLSVPALLNTANANLQEYLADKIIKEAPVKEARRKQILANERLETAEITKSQADTKVTDATPPGGQTQEEKVASIAAADFDLTKIDKIRLWQEVEKEKKFLDDVNALQDRVEQRVVALKQAHEKRTAVSAGISTWMICGIVAAAVAVAVAIMTVILWKWQKAKKKAVAKAKATESRATTDTEAPQAVSTAIAKDQ